MIKFKHKNKRKGEIVMKKSESKIKILKCILLVIAIILCILLAIVVRRTIILSKIDKKVSELENNNNNFYIKTSYIDRRNYTSVIRRYIKGDVSKLVIEKTTAEGNNAKIIEITYPEERKLFTEVNDSKVMNVYKEKTAVRGAHIEKGTESSYTTFSNPGYSTSINDLIVNAIVTSIKTVKMDGKDCYELSSKMNTNFLYDDNTTKFLIYVEKETCLTLKIVEEVNVNGEIKQVVKDFEYQFNQVTDEEISEPDNSEYKMQENS